MGYFMDIQKYLVIIGDIVKSREIKDREKFQEIFEKKSKMIEVFEPNDIVSTFTVTIGDEFQGVLKNANRLFKFIDELEYGLNMTLAYKQSYKNPERAKQSYTLRYGIGVGKITTKINKDAAIGMDGPAFYNARKSIENAKKNSLKYFFESGSENDVAINILLNWLSTENKKWNSRKFQIVKLYKDRWTQKQIAESLRISQPAVSKILKNAPVELSIKTEQLVEKEINKIINLSNSTQYSMVAEPESK